MMMALNLKRFKFFYISNLSVGMSYYKGGTINLLKCVTKCSILYTYILSCSAKTTKLSLFSPLLSCLVRHSRTKHDNKGENSDRLAVLAEHMRMYVYKIEHLVAHFRTFIMSPFIVWHSYTQI